MKSNYESILILIKPSEILVSKTSFLTLPKYLAKLYIFLLETVQGRFSRNLYPFCNRAFIFRTKKVNNFSKLKNISALFIITTSATQCSLF